MNLALVKVSIALVKSMIKTTWGEKGVLDWQSSSPCRKAKGDRNLEARTTAEARRCDIAHWIVLHGLLILLSSIQDHQSSYGSTQNGLCPPTSTTNKENAPQTT